jgi:sugar phosphate isomerase/epimerase
MKLSCLAVSYFKSIIDGNLSIRELAQQVSKIGYDAIDLSVILLESRNDEYLRGVVKDIEDNDLHVAVVNTYPDFTHPDAAVRKQQQAQIKEDIYAASLLNAEMVRITAGQAHPQTSRKEGVKWATEGLLSAVETSKSCGIKLVYENHSKPGVWEYPDFSLPSDIFLEIVAALKETPIEILFDTANPLVNNEDPLPLLGKVVDRVGCVHAADIKTRGRLEPVVIGTGIVPFSQLFSFLRGAGYDGWISIEEASATGYEGMASAAAFIREL